MELMKLLLSLFDLGVHGWFGGSQGGHMVCSLAQDNLICAPSLIHTPDGPPALGLSAPSLHTVALAAWDTFFPSS